MSKVDWTKPIEAYHEDGRVGEAVIVRKGDGDYLVHSDVMPEDGSWYFAIENHVPWAGWRIRNVAEPKDDVPAWAVKRALAEVNDFPTGPGGGEKWTMDEIIDRRRGVFRYQAAVITLARYIAAHEQPPVDPDLIEARKIAIDNLQGMSEDVKSTYTRGIQSGEYDAENRVGVKLALAAIKRGRELERGEGK